MLLWHCAAGRPWQRCRGLPGLPGRVLICTLRSLIICWVAVLQ